MDINNIYHQVLRTAYNFAKRQGRQYDQMYVEECQAEALFVVTELIWNHLPALKEKYPDVNQRQVFYRMTIGYKLKEYWAYRPTCTISYLKKRGIVITHESIREEHKSINNDELEMNLILEDICQSEIERQVVKYIFQGNDEETIAKKCELELSTVNKILKRIQYRLQAK